MRNTQEAMNMFQNLIYYEKLSWSSQFLIPVLSVKILVNVLFRPLPCKGHIPTLLSIVAHFSTFVAPTFCSLFQPFSFSLFPSSSLLFCYSLRLCSLSSSSTFCFLASRLLSRLFSLSAHLFSSSSLISLSSCPLFSVLSGQKTVLL